MTFVQFLGVFLMFLVVSGVIWLILFAISTPRSLEAGPTLWENLVWHYHQFRRRQLYNKQK